jgi:hypothetical protein
VTRRTPPLTLALSLIALTVTAGADWSEQTRANDATSMPQNELNLSCPELDDQLTELAPQTYSSTPGFYSDPHQGIAVWLGVSWSPAWIYVGYSGLMEQYRQGRISDTHAEMEQLRLLKARRHCYE